MQSVPKCSAAFGGIVCPHGSENRFLIIKRRGTQDSVSASTGSRCAVSARLGFGLCGLHDGLTAGRTRNCSHGIGCHQVFTAFASVCVPQIFSSCQPFQVTQRRHPSSILQVCRASHEDEFKSSRNIALGLHRRYKDVVDGGFANLKVLSVPLV